MNDPEMVKSVRDAIIEAMWAHDNVAHVDVRARSNGLFRLDGEFDLAAIARAAIEAMREPTPEMVAAGVERFSDLLQAGVGSEYLMTEAAKAMIDAALAEPTAPR